MKNTSARAAILLTIALALLFSVGACRALTFSPVTGSAPASGEATSPAASSAPVETLLPASLPVVGSTADLQTASPDLESKLIQVYKTTNPAVVFIITPTGTGSGFVYDADGHLVTNHHVIAGASTFEIVFSNGERQRASLVGSDPDSDLAVLKVEALPEGVQPIPLAKEELLVGQFVVAIGNPFGEQGSMSLGIVSGLGRSLRSQRSSYSLPQVIQTDAPINPGNSGGPLLNLKGEVAGINSAIATTTGTNSGVGFAIPVAAVARIVPSLIETGRYVYPYMGVVFGAEIDLDTQSRLRLPQSWGAYVVSTTQDGPAAASGLVAANLQNGLGGDLIIALDGKQVRNFSDLNSYLIFHTEVGQTIEVTVLRGREQVTLSLTLGARP